MVDKNWATTDALIYSVWGTYINPLTFDIKVSEYFEEYEDCNKLTIVIPEIYDPFNSSQFL